VSTDDWSEELIVATFMVAGWLIEKEIRDLFSLKRKKGDALMTGDFVLISDCAFTKPIEAGQLEHGGKHLLQFMRFGEIVQSVLNCDFLRFHPILTILFDFNPISSIFNFFKRFNM
jgi:hypothetical protein